MTIKKRSTAKGDDVCQLLKTTKQRSLSCLLSSSLVQRLNGEQAVTGTNIEQTKKTEALVRSDVVSRKHVCGQIFLPDSDRVSLRFK